MVRTGKVHHTQVRNDLSDIDVIKGIAARQPLWVIADGTHHVALALNKNAFGMFWHKERIGVADRIAGEPPHAQQLHLGRRIGAAQCRDIGLTKTIDLTGAHECVTRTTPHIVKNAREAHPILVSLS